MSSWQAIRATEASISAEKANAEEKEQRLAAEAEREHSRRSLYASEMNSAQQALKLNNIGRARRLLEHNRPQAGEEDLRGWEWRYLWQLTRSSPLITLTNRIARGTAVSFSPDGHLIAAGWYGGRLELWDVPGIGAGFGASPTATIYTITRSARPFRRFAIR